MKILFTGSSSFTGYWFIKELAAQGHAVTAVVRGKSDQYTGLRKQRLDGIAKWATIIWNCSFGDPAFLDLLDQGFDAVCHHGAQVENYKSPDFDVAAAVRSNTLNCRQVMEKLKDEGRLIVTGSVFEANEGIGNAPLVAFSPYGLSKTSSWEVFRYWGWKLSVPLTKFVIPNPFGPYEEPRFCNYLVQTWKKGEIPAINTPDYIRDNIHADLLAKHYVAALEGPVKEKIGPSGYIESQGSFGVRFAREMATRLPLRCEVRLGKQTSFDEPLIRTNDALSSGPGIHPSIAAWDEKKAWDELAEYYKKQITI